MDSTVRYQYTAILVFDWLKSTKLSKPQKIVNKPIKYKQLL